MGLDPFRNYDAWLEPPHQPELCPDEVEVDLDEESLWAQRMEQAEQEAYDNQLERAEEAALERRAGLWDGP